MVDYVADYLETISTRRVLPEVKPGYLSALLPDRAPVKPQSWTSIMDDVNHAIMPGVCIIIVFFYKGAITSKIKHAIKHKTSPARLAQLLQPSLAFCFSLQPMTAYRPVLF